MSSNYNDVENGRAIDGAIIYDYSRDNMWRRIARASNEETVFLGANASAGTRSKWGQNGYGGAPVHAPPLGPHAGRLGLRDATDRSMAL